MSQALTMAQLESEQVELLPDRTLMCGATSDPSGSSTAVGGNGGNGGIGVNLLNINVLGSQTNSAGNGGAGGGALSVG